MAKTKTQLPDAPSAPAPAAVAHRPNVFERLIDAIRARPRFWSGLLIALAVAALAVVLGLQYFRSQEEQKRADAFRALSEAESNPVEADRLAALKDPDVLNKLKGTEFEPAYWWARSQAAFDGAQKEQMSDKRLTLLQECRDATRTLIESFPSTPWTRVAWKSSPTPTEVAPTLAQRRLNYCNEQISFLETNRAAARGPVTHDEGVLVTLTLKDTSDDAAAPRTLKLRVFSSVAPIAVHQMLQNIEAGRWVGTHVFGLEDFDPNTESIDGVRFGSALSRSPWATDLHGGEQDWVQATLPVERTGLEVKKGSLGFALRREAGRTVGADPMQLVLYTGDQQPDEAPVIFAQAEDSDATLTWLSEDIGANRDVVVGGSALGNTFAPKKTIRVEGVEISGKPAHTPEVPLTLDWVEPDQPEKPTEKPPEAPGGTSESEGGGGGL